MRIEEEIKLDYSDVLFRPKRSTLKSRKEVDLTRTYKLEGVSCCTNIQSTKRKSNDGKAVRALVPVLNDGTCHAPVHGPCN